MCLTSMICYLHLQQILFPTSFQDLKIKDNSCFSPKKTKSRNHSRSIVNARPNLVLILISVKFTTKSLLKLAIIGQKFIWPEILIGVWQVFRLWAQRALNYSFDVTFKEFLLFAKRLFIEVSVKFPYIAITLVH